MKSFSMAQTIQLVRTLKSHNLFVANELGMDGCKAPGFMGKCSFEMIPYFLQFFPLFTSFAFLMPFERIASDAAVIVIAPNE